MSSRFRLNLPSSWYTHDIRQSELERIAKGYGPFQFGKQIDSERMRDLEELARYAKEKGITLIGITPPYHSSLNEAIHSSEHFEYWKTFSQRSFVSWFESLGINYFDFSKVNSFSGNETEFVDGFHSSEPAHARMLITMMKSQKIRDQLTEIDLISIKSRLNNATSLQLYKNEF